MEVTELIEAKTLCNIPNRQNLGKPLLLDINEGRRQPKGSESKKPGKGIVYRS